MEPTAIFDVLKKVSKENCEDFFFKYSYDFVRLVHQHFHLKGRENEQKIVEYEVWGEDYNKKVDVLCTSLNLAY